MTVVVYVDSRLSLLEYPLNRKIVQTFQKERKSTEENSLLLNKLTNRLENLVVTQRAFVDRDARHFGANSLLQELRLMAQGCISSVLLIKIRH